MAKRWYRSKGTFATRDDRKKRYVFVKGNLYQLDMDKLPKRLHGQFDAAADLDEAPVEDTSKRPGRKRTTRRKATTSPKSDETEAE